MAKRTSGERSTAGGAVPGAAAPATALPAASPLEERLRYTFRDPSLLQLALTHSSLAFEMNEGRTNATTEDNEQLEFLGDAVAGLVITELLVKHFPERREGDLTRMRALLVSGKGMSEAGIRLGIGKDLLLGKGEDSSGGRAKAAILADTIEAITAAIYLDSGVKAARTFVEREIFRPRLAELKAAAKQGARFGGVVGDWKSALQELLQSRAAGQPSYRTVEETGSDHNKRFRVEVLLQDEVLGEGEGASKKTAQQAAAHMAYDRLAPAGDMKQDDPA